MYSSSVVRDISRGYVQHLVFDTLRKNVGYHFLRQKPLAKPIIFKENH